MIRGRSAQSGYKDGSINEFQDAVTAHDYSVLGPWRGHSQVLAQWYAHDEQDLEAEPAWRSLGPLHPNQQGGQLRVSEPLCQGAIKLLRVSPGQVHLDRLAFDAFASKFHLRGQTPSDLGKLARGDD